MARFRNNQQQIVVSPLYRADGLKIERVQRFDHTALPEVDRWLSWSFRITLGGTRYVKYAEHTYTLAPSTIFWSSPLDESVRIRRLPGTGSDSVLLTFAAQRWRQFVEQHSGFQARNATLLTGQPNRSLLALQIAPPQLLHVLRQLVALGQAPGAPALAVDNCRTLLLRLIADLQFDIAIQAESHERRLRVEQAQARMVARLARPPSLCQIAVDLSVSPRQLQRDFVAFTGLTPIRYLNLVRLSEANTLLARSALPIAEVAALLGYASATHFSTAFRQVYGCSPRQIRQQNEEWRMKNEE
jgi:AraC-like DNA-binding protein